MAAEMSEIDRLKANLEHRRSQLGLSEIGLAKRAGLPRDAVRDIFRGKSKGPSAFRVKAIAEALNCTIDELLGGTSRVAPGDEEFVLVPAYDTRASAGPGAFFADDRIIFRLAFRDQWLRQVTGAQLKNLAVIQADGDSMESTIHDGDHMLVDKTQLNPRRDGIYIIAWDGLINVKRVTTDPARGTLTIASDNPKYHQNEGVNPDDIEVQGRVIWIGRRV